jgi:FkbM family methyltransferase
MISYAYNREDVLLDRLFKEQQTGFYVDVGAGKPVRGSVTKHFYDRGWRGINVEPTRSLFALLEDARPGDVNLNVALSSQPGSMEFYEFEERHWALSTLDKRQAERHAETGRRYRTLEVPVKTLAEVCEEHVTGGVDFMSIDVEGHELGVIRGGDWRRWRPRCLVVEATEPNTQIPSHSEWEPLLLEAGYLFGYFDGLNRFYLRSEDAALMECFKTPVNVFDDFETFECRWQIDALRSELAAAKELLSGRGAGS